MDSWVRRVWAWRKSDSSCAGFSRHSVFPPHLNIPLLSRPVVRAADLNAAEEGGALTCFPTAPRNETLGSLNRGRSSRCPVEYMSLPFNNNLFHLTTTTPSNSHF